MRSSNGCWTCRLRRKKCDEKYPVCNVCATLQITCHFDEEKPEWMDGGARQDEMAQQLKREVKERGYRRNGERTTHVSGDRVLDVETSDISNATLSNDGTEPSSETSATRPQRGADCTQTNKEARGISFGRSDTILVTFYLEHVLPFLFPFYRPSPLEGGRAWILEMMISSPVVRQTALCQSSYFFSLARGTSDHDALWETVLAQTRDAFVVLGQALQVLSGSDIAEHLHGAVRIMASIMQVQRFEIAILSFDNCQAHLNGAVALFKQLLAGAGVTGAVGAMACFNTVISQLGPTSWTSPAQTVQVQSAEQAAFRFSSALLIFDDIIASTVLQEEPKLYQHHPCLLTSTNDTTDPPINFEAIVGCQNWVLLQISEISVLDAWKRRCKRAGTLNVMELVHRATAIKCSLEDRLIELENNPIIIPKEGGTLLDVFTAEYSHDSNILANQSRLVTQVWAHAALIYLSVVVSGWQPASADIRLHVGRIIELLIHRISPPALLRTMVWPFCVAGCLAEPRQEAHFRCMVEELQPPSVFGMVRKALEIMQSAWCNRYVENASDRDFATWFRSQGSDLVLLI